MGKGHLFTWQNYTNILRELKKRNYQFISFSQVEQFLARNERFVLLRHDIDMDVEATLPMAYIEAEEGIQSTYFFLVCSGFYNIFSNESSRVLRELTRIGHTIGVHFNCAIYPEISPANMRGYVLPEVKLFETWYNTNVEVISFHRPGNLELNGNIDLTPIRHPYEDIFFKKIAYLSDSRGMWRYGYPLESRAYITGESMQLLIHPIWWNSDAEEVISRLDRMLEARTKYMRELVELNCTPYRERFVNQTNR